MDFRAPGNLPGGEDHAVLTKASTKSAMALLGAFSQHTAGIMRSKSRAASRINRDRGETTVTAKGGRDQAGEGQSGWRSPRCTILTGFRSRLMPPSPGGGSQNGGFSDNADLAGEYAEEQQNYDTLYFMLDSSFQGADDLAIDRIAKAVEKTRQRNWLDFGIATNIEATRNVRCWWL
jgi:hypothetical protein